MLNIDHIRRAPHEVAAGLARRGEDPDLATLLRLDQERRIRRNGARRSPRYPQPA